MAVSRKYAEKNPFPSAPTNLEAPKVSKRPNWCLFYTGGLLTTGGLGWGLRIAYAEKPKAAMLSYLAGSAGLCLLNMAVIPRPGKKASKTSGPNWLMMIPGTVLSGAGFGYCLSLTLKENPKSTVMAYAVGSLGYIMASAALYTMCRKTKKEKDEEKMEKEKRHRNDNEFKFNPIYQYPRIFAEFMVCENCKDYVERELHAENLTELHPRIHAELMVCENCKDFVERELHKRKEAEKRWGLRAICNCLWNSIKKVGPLTGRGEDKELTAEKKTSLGNSRSESSKTCGDKNNPKVSSKREPSVAPRPKSISREEFKARYKGMVPWSMPALSKQMESRAGEVFLLPWLEKNFETKSTQTEESYLVRSNETSMEDPPTIEGQLEDEECALADELVRPPSGFTNESQLLLEVPSEDEQLELEDKQ